MTVQGLHSAQAVEHSIHQMTTIAKVEIQVKREYNYLRDNRKWSWHILCGKKAHLQQLE